MHEIDRRLFDGNPDAFVALAADGTVLHWNAAAERIFGYRCDEAVGRALADLIGADDATALVRMNDGGSAEAEVYESVCRRRDGLLLHASVTTRLLGDASVHAIATFKDVTHLKVSRDARLLEAQFRGVLESTPDAIVLVGLLGRIVLVNAQAEALFGYRRDELIGQPVEALLPQRFHATHHTHRNRYFERPRTRTMGAGLELFGRRKDGTEFPVEISLSPLQTEEGTMVMSAVRDITDRKRAEQKFRGLLEAAPDAIVIVGGSGAIELVNSQTERLFGYVRDELLRQPIEMLIPPRYRAGHPAHRGAFFAQPRVRAMGATLQLHALRKDGTEFPVEISLSPIETEDGMLVSAAIRDVTDRKQVESVLQQKNVELANASRAKDAFLASMSHELRTPLNAIIGFTGTLLMRLPGPLTAEQEKQLRTVQSSARHLLSLINGLLDVAKIEAGKVELHPEPVHVMQMLDEVCATLAPEAERKGLRLDLRIAADVVVVADRRALQQILLNLVANAVKFTARGEVAIVVREAADAIEIDVRDTGPGIPRDQQARLFEPFMQAAGVAANTAGTGLGLYLSRKLSELLNGRLTLDSEPGHGSTFTLHLPRA